MHFRPSQPVNRPVLIALCLFAIAFALAIFAAANANAAFYDVVFCAGGNGAGDPVPGARPAFFDWGTNCGEPPSYPSDGGHYLRLNENAGGTAGQNDEVSLSWYAPSGTSIVAGGGYTREPNAFNDGWRARFWGEDWWGGAHNIMLQGTGIEGNDGITKNTTSIFASHLWPFGGWDDYKRFVFGLWCVRPAGCDRANFNAVDANTITLVANDSQSPQVSFVDAAIIRGEWVRGYNPLSWFESDQGSGLRFSRLGTDSSVFGDGTIDYQANGGCRIGYRDGGREFGKSLQPCTLGPYQRWYGLETKNLSDGQHTLAICLQDYGQYKAGTDTCDRRTIHTDNTPPGKPASLEVTSANPARYLRHFGASFSLPPDPGSPIAKVHYQVLNGKGEVVVPEKTAAATNPTSLTDVEGPATPGAYHLKLWLEDSVGFSGPAAEAPIPHDTTPPAAPQELRVAGPGTHWLDKLDVRWRNIVDEGSPIDTARYQLLDPSGGVLGSTHVIGADNPQAIAGVDAPAQRCACALRVWLQDEEGNVGAPSTVRLPIDTTPPASPQGLQVAAPDTPRSRDGFDLRWSNIGDDGSPIEAAHYEVLDASGHVVVPERTERRGDVTTIADVQAPAPSGGYTLKLWLSDEEGNRGAPASVPLSYECARSPVSGGATLTALPSADTVEEGQDVALIGALRQDSGAPVTGASLCVFEQVEGDSTRHYLGVAYTDAAGRYRFAVSPGPNRTLRAVYRPGNRRLAAQADVKTRVHPTLRARKTVIHNGEVAHLEGQIPGPRGDDVVIVIQVRQGKGWLAFRRYRTRGGGRFRAAYPFHRTTRPTTYEFRAQVRESSGYPYLEGDSDPIALKVLPKAKHRRQASIAQRCVRARRAVRRRPAAKGLRHRAHRLCARAHRKRHAHAQRRAG
jgi:Bacterial Ig-like domain